METVPEGNMVVLCPTNMKQFLCQKNSISPRSAGGERAPVLTSWVWVWVGAQLEEWGRNLLERRRREHFSQLRRLHKHILYYYYLGPQYAQEKIILETPKIIKKYLEVNFCTLIIIVNNNHCQTLSLQKEHKQPLIFYQINQICLYVI